MKDPNARVASRKSILIVDDEEDMSSLLEAKLRLEGYDVVVVPSGEDALLNLPAIQPDLVLMDLLMPGIDGLETLKILRSHPDFARLPVIISSGAHPLVNQHDYQWSGFLPKPFKVKELVHMIQELI